MKQTIFATFTILFLFLFLFRKIMTMTIFLFSMKWKENFHDDFEFIACHVIKI